MRTSEIVKLLPDPLIKIIVGRMHDDITSNLGSHDHRVLKEKLGERVVGLEQCITHLRNLGYMIAMPAATVAEVNDPSRVEIMASIGDNFPRGVDGIRCLRGHPLCVLVAACIRAGDVEMSSPIPPGTKRPRELEW